MIKRSFGAVLALTLVAGVFSALPARAATQIPEVVQIEDPIDDANFLNDQDVYQPGVCEPPCQGDVAEGDNSTVSDLIKIWFTHTADELSVHFLTQRPPPASTTIYYRVAANPSDVDPRGCLNFRAVFPGVTQGQSTPTYLGEQFAEFEDTCNAAGVLVDGKIVIEELEDTTGITTLTFPRTEIPSLADGTTITGPYGLTRFAFGTNRDDWQARGQADNTKRGADYTITGEPTVTEPGPPGDTPGANDPPGKKKGCKKGKGKKKGCKKEGTDPVPTPDECAAYVPGEQGKEAKTTVVTDDATEAKPIKFDVETDVGIVVAEPVFGTVLHDAASHVYHNIQVDPKAAEAGLYLRFDFPAEAQDYDIYLNDAAGKKVAAAAGFNQVLAIPGAPVGNDTSSGGHSEFTAEALDGVKSADCVGYTLEIRGFMTDGGTGSLSLWLGEGKYAPPAPAVVAAVESIF